MAGLHAVVTRCWKEEQMLAAGSGMVGADDDEWIG